MSEPSGYKESFLSEARSNLAGMNAALLEAERSPQRRGLVDEIFRSAHNIKSMAAMMEREQTAALCHALEDALDAVRKGGLPLERSADALFRCFDALDSAIATVARGAPEPDLASAIAELRRLASGGAAAPESAGPADEPEAYSPRIDVVQVRMDRLDLLMNLAEELVIAKLRFDALKSKIRAPEIVPLVDVFGRLATEIQYQVTQARLVPVRLIFDRFPRLARDIARRQGKEVELALEGGDIELDRRVAEEIGDALIHLLRNAVDHGIESPERRKASAKPPRGVVRVAAARTRDSAVIVVEDDGAGLDFEAIAGAAAARGLLPASASREELLRAVAGGLSTKPRATLISGRGLGLDIVRRKVESLGGTLTVRSDAGRGAAFRLEIPLALAIVKGLFVEVGGRNYVVPLAGVEKIVPVATAQVKGMMGRETAVIDHEDIPLLRMRALFGVQPSGQARFPVVVVGSGRRRLGLAVDALVATQDIVLKPLGRALRGGSRFSGSTISGTGEAILVLDVASLIQEAFARVPA
ncbi:MAG: chemotaxis protein CheW [Elusimicrobia bacterium]|nr:chemotaxis protein CheW [Elusimicrobiota bacterium]